MAAGVTTASIQMSSSFAAASQGYDVGLSTTGGVVTSGALPAVSSLSCAPASLGNSGSSTCTVTLSGNAPAGGAGVSLSSNNSSLATPGSVTVPAASTSTTFTVTTGVLSSSSSATISATYNSSSANTTVSLVAPVTVPASASFVKMDTATQGSWRGVYGTNGYAVAGDQTSNPSYVSPAPAGESTWIWASSTAAVRALQKPSNPTNRIAAAWYNSTSFTIDLNISDTAQHQIALYCLDWDWTSRRETVAILDAKGNVLNTQSLTASFNGGVYLVWNVTGHVVIRVTLVAGPNAVASGLFFDAPESGVTFVKTDTTTQGSWQGVYGTNGYAVIGDQTSNPSYVSPAPAGESTWVWASSTAALRALQKPSNPTNRIAAAWYNSTPFTIDLNISDTAQHQIALYCLDWDSTSRRENVAILDAKGNVLNTQSLAGSFNGGVYLVWNVTGHVVIRVTLVAGSNAVVSGLFFDPAAVGGTQTAAALPLPNVRSAAEAAEKAPGVTVGSQSEVSGLACFPRLVTAGSQVSCELRVPASPGPAQVSLTSYSNQVKLPAAVMTRANQSSLTFQASVDPMAKQQTAIVAAALGDSLVEDKIEVVPGAGPVLTAPEKLTAEWGAPLSFTVTAADPDGQPVQLAADDLPAGASVDATSHVFTWIPKAAQQGPYSIRFTATNSALQSTSAVTALTVDDGRSALSTPQTLDCSPNAIASVTGKWLAAAGTELSEPSGDVLELAQVAVKINGEAAPVLFSSATETRFLCPADEPGAQLSVVVETPRGRTDPLIGTMRAVSPTVLSLDGTGRQQGLILFAGTPDLAMERNYRVAAHPAQPGDELVIWATGLGGAGAAPSNVQVKIGGVYAGVESVQTVAGHVGLFAIQMLVPPGIPAGDAVPVQLELTTAHSQRVVSNSVTAAFEAIGQ